MNTHGDRNRDWTNVDWLAREHDFTGRLTITALVNGAQIRSYEYPKDAWSSEQLRLLGDLFAALKQHRERM